MSGKDRPKPPLDEIEITHDGIGGTRKPYVTMSVDCLEAILAAETSTIAPGDVRPLMGVFCYHARRSGRGDRDLATTLEEAYDGYDEDE